MFYSGLTLNVGFDFSKVLDISSLHSSTPHPLLKRISHKALITHQEITIKTQLLPPRCMGTKY